MSSASVCPQCGASSERWTGQCPACGGAHTLADAAGFESGEAREFGAELSDVGIKLDDGSTACPVAFGPYRVLGLLGKGGMGLVYRAIHEETHEEVAVKTVRVRKRGMLHRIRREIHALARTRHPGLVRIIEIGQSEGLPWYAMELLKGRSLHDLMLEGRRPPQQGEDPEPPKSSGWDTRADFILASGSGNGDSDFALADGTTATVGIAQNPCVPRPRRTTECSSSPRRSSCHRKVRSWR